ncbi:MAG: glycosyltransferase [Glycocaulis sp.]
MRVLIWTAGGGDAGIGHLTRCQSLIPALLKRGAEVQVIAQADISLAPFIEAEGAGIQLIPDEGAALSALKRALPADLLVADRPDLTQADSAAHYAAGAARIVLLASSRIGRYSSDLAIVDDPVLTETDPPMARRIEVGAHLHMVRPDVLALRPTVPVVLDAGNPCQLLIALSGTDPGELTEPLLTALHRDIRARSLPVHLSAVIGAGWEAKRRLNLLESVDEDIETIDQPASLASTIASADAVVTLGGRTTYEAFALGRPAFCVPWDTTADYVFALHAQKLALAVDPEPEKAARAILAALDSPADINARAARAFNIVDAGAADRVAALCLEALS